MCEYNDAVIKMLRKGYAPAMAHVARTHRVKLDWQLERSFDDPNVYCRYLDTQPQLADIHTKMNFTSADWCRLCTVLRIETLKDDQRVPEVTPTSMSSTSTTSTSGSNIKSGNPNWGPLPHGLYSTKTTSKTITNSTSSIDVPKHRGRKAPGR